MIIVVLVKACLDTERPRDLSLGTGLAVRSDEATVLDEMSDRALQAALTHRDREPDTEVVTLMLAPAGAAATLRKTLAIGADRGIHIVDDDLVGADILLTARTIAAGIATESYDLVLAGDTSTDGSSGMVPAAIAELLGLPLAAGLTSVTIATTSVTGEREADSGTEHIEVGLPALACVTDASEAARLPNFKGIMAAKKKPVTTFSLDELGIEADPDVVPSSIMLTAEPTPPKSGGIKLVDDATAGTRLCDYLVEEGVVR